MSRLMRLFAVLFVVAALAACSPSSGGGQPVSTSAALLKLSNADAGRTVTVSVGAEIDLTLQTVGPGNYGTPQVSSSAVKFDSVSQVSPVVPAGPTQLFKFTAVSVGPATISIPSTGQSPAFVLTVQAK